MRDIKTWLETTGEPIAKTAFVDAVPLPFIVFLDNAERGGADERNLITTHDVTIERYSLTNDGNDQIEALLDSAAIEYTREQIWLSKPESCFMTIFDFSYTEKD